VKVTEAVAVVEFAKPSVAVAVPIVGVTGRVAGVIELLALDATLVPAVFVAVTLKV
jgi:hypothetical protein